MDNNETQPQSFVEMVLALLEDCFPWLGKDEPPSRAETVGPTKRLLPILEAIERASVALTTFLIGRCKTL